MNEWIIAESMNQWFRANQWIFDPMSRWINEATNQRIIEPMKMNPGMNASTNQWISMNQWNIMKAVPMRFFYSRLQTRIAERCTKSTKVRAASMLQRGLDHTNLELVCAPHEIKLSLKSGARFADLVFQKCHAPLARNIFVEQNRALTTVSCAFCQQRSPQPRKQRYPRSQISRKKTQGFAPESVFVRNFAAFLTLPNYLVMSAWHDDVVVMIMWLTWLWNAYHDYRP